MFHMFSSFSFHGVLPFGFGDIVIVWKKRFSFIVYNVISVQRSLLFILGTNAFGYVSYHGFLPFGFGEIGQVCFQKEVYNVEYFMTLVRKCLLAFGFGEVWTVSFHNVHSTSAPPAPRTMSGGARTV